jgi:hypothetical protein
MNFMKDVVPLLSAAFVITAISITGCANPSTPSKPTFVSQALVIPPAEASGFVDARMKIFVQYVYGPAKATGGAFPAYKRWLSACAAAIQDGVPANLTQPGNAANLELASYKVPLGPTKDLELIAAYSQGTDLNKLAGQLLEIFNNQSVATRTAAATALQGGYSL